MNNVTLGQYIKQQRELQHLSTAELAKKSGLSVGYINRIEHDKTENHNIIKLKQLADALLIDYDYILSSIGYGVNDIEEKDWRLEIQNILTREGFDKDSVLEILNYIETVRYKQDLKDYFSVKTNAGMPYITKQKKDLINDLLKAKGYNNYINYYMNNFVNGYMNNLTK